MLKPNKIRWWSRVQVSGTMSNERISFQFNFCIASSTQMELLFCQAWTWKNEILSTTFFATPCFVVYTSSMKRSLVPNIMVIMHSLLCMPSTFHAKRKSQPLKELYTKHRLNAHGHNNRAPVSTFSLSFLHPLLLTALHGFHVRKPGCFRNRYLSQDSSIQRHFPRHFGGNVLLIAPCIIPLFSGFLLVKLHHHFWNKPFASLMSITFISSHKTK